MLTAVLHHDLHADMRAAVRQVLRAHRLLRGAPTSVPANVEVVTPYTPAAHPGALTAPRAWVGTGSEDHVPG